jgi:hypothetical protein
MRRATPNQRTKMEPFIFELGSRANKVEILHKDDSIEIIPKGWLGKRTWREINEVLLRNGFEWLPSGKDSCWIKIKK